jgi:hypothetical protein
MASICERKNSLIWNLSELREEEVYIRLNSPGKQLYSYVSANSVQNSPTAAMKRMKKPDENCLKDFPPTTIKNTNTSSTTLDYFPVEVLRYAPLNQADLQLIYKLPSILARISQLYDIEQLMHLLATKIPSYPVCLFTIVNPLIEINKSDVCFYCSYSKLIKPQLLLLMIV